MSNDRLKLQIENSFSLRGVTLGDEDFLLQLFSSTRSEFDFLEPGQRETLVRMQFDLQRRQYEDAYPNAEHQIIVRDGKPIGRIFIDPGGAEMTLVDIALLPEHRSLGIGGCLIARLLARAAALGKVVRLHVLKSNPARHLYERLGFAMIGEDGMYFEMVSQPIGINKGGT